MMPVPVSPMVEMGGVPLAVLIFKFAAFPPAVVGAKDTDTVQDAAGARFGGQSVVRPVNCPGLAPPSVGAFRLRFVMPTLVIVTDWAVLVVPTVWFPNASKLGVTV